MAKNKNLDNANNRLDSNDEILSDHRAAEEGTEAFEMDDGSDIIDDEDIMPKFSLVDEDDDDDETEDLDDDTEPDDEPEEESDDDQDDEDDEDDEPEEEESPAPRRTAKKTSKEERAIVAQKRENKRLRDENRKMQERLAQRDTKTKQSSLEQKYIDDGHDEATAKFMAAQDMRTQQQQDRLELLEFKDENSDVLKKYPDASKDIARIKRTVDAAGITVEQACRGLYGSADLPTYEKRARDRVAADDDTDDNSVSRSTRASKAPVRQSRLSAEDRRAKQFIETKFLSGEKLSDKEFLRHYKKG